MSSLSLLAKARKDFHRRLVSEVAELRQGLPNFADKHSESSKRISTQLWSILCPRSRRRDRPLVRKNRARSTRTAHVDATPGQTVGQRFQTIVRDFLETTLNSLSALRPGPWEYRIGEPISSFAQYTHVAGYLGLYDKLEDEPGLRVLVPQDYIVKPDVVVARRRLTAAEINQRHGGQHVVEPCVGCRSTLRRDDEDGSPQFLLHASVSCKWTIRSDRAQNARTEALNLLRMRKGHSPHIVLVTMEPLPTRIACVALGTGDIDCVYHAALNELIQACQRSGNSDQIEMLETLVKGDRLRDIADLPLDLAA